MKKRIFIVLFQIVILTFLYHGVSAQTTEFTFQGSLKNAGTNANGNFDFEFALFDTLAGGSQLGSTISLNGVAVSEGIFSVKLDFGNQFTGASRFLEIRVRQTGGGTFTVLSPRQLINSAPYSVKSLNAENATTANNALSLGGVTANQFVQTTDARLSDSRNPLPNSPNYIQNGTTQQTSSNFNISGTGTANIFNAGSQFNLGGNRILSIAGTNNLFAGITAGAANTTGLANAFFGTFSGQGNTAGTSNSFFGSSSGFANATGNDNAFFGTSAGSQNSSGSFNTFSGSFTGFNNTTGSQNSFFGSSAGAANTIGTLNTAIGRSANFGSPDLTNATAIGARAQVNTSNSIVLGSINGVNGSNVDTNVGIGTTSPTARLHVVGNSTITGNLVANTLGGNGSAITNLNAGNFSTGILPIARGGTGLSSAGSTVGNYLRSGQIPPSLDIVWTSSPIQPADIPSGSAYYIQDRTGSPELQVASVAITGDGTFGGTVRGNVVNAATQYNIGGNRVLSNSGTNNLFAGIGAGNNNTTGNENSFFGKDAGLNNTTGNLNSFFGRNAGAANTTGRNNSFFGSFAGFANNGNSNSFFGINAGFSNTIGNANSFFGISAGARNTTGDQNSFFGDGAGENNTTGTFNSFFGVVAGVSNTTGLFLTMIGSGADVGSTNLTNATAIGATARVSQSNSLVLGSINGVNGATADTNVGIGTTAPTAKLTLRGTGVFNAAGAARFDILNSASATNYLQHVTDSGSWQLATTAGQTRILVDSSGIVSINNLATATATTLCRNGNQIAACTSSIRYKENLNPFGAGLNLIRRLRPVTFNWKGGGTLDLGLVAEEVFEVEPLLVTLDDKGEVEGVKYDRLGIVLVNAVNQQQTQIESLEKKVDEQKEIIKKQAEQLSRQDEFLKSQQAQIDALNKFICSNNPAAEICTPQN